MHLKSEYFILLAMEIPTRFREKSKANVMFFAWRMQVQVLMKNNNNINNKQI